MADTTASAEATARFTTKTTASAFGNAEIVIKDIRNQCKKQWRLPTIMLDVLQNQQYQNSRTPDLLQKHKEFSQQTTAISNDSCGNLEKSPKKQ